MQRRIFYVQGPYDSGDYFLFLHFVYGALGAPGALVRGESVKSHKN